MGIVCVTPRNPSLQYRKPPIPEQFSNPAVLSMIRNTWCDDFTTMYPLAQSIYSQLFMLEPSIVYMFPPLVSSGDPTDLKNNQEFSRLSIRLVQALDRCVRDLEDHEKLQDDLANIGIFDMLRLTDSVRTFRTKIGTQPLSSTSVQVYMTLSFKFKPRISETLQVSQSSSDLSRADSVPTPPPYPKQLSDPEFVDVVRRTWCADFSQMYCLAELIYSQLFALDPTLMKMFPPLTNTKNPLDMKNNRQFAQMSIKLVQVLDKCIKKMNEPEFLHEELKEIGIRHVRYITRGFNEGHWDLACQSICKALKLHLDTIPGIDQEKAYEYWNITIRYFVDIMKVAFLAAKAKQKPT